MSAYPPKNKNRRATQSQRKKNCSIIQKIVDQNKKYKKTATVPIGTRGEVEKI